MKPYIVAATLWAALVLAGCASAPEPGQVAAADIGPLPSNYQEVVKAYYAETLFDPYSAVFVFKAGPFRGYAGNRIEGANIGWIVCGTLNAKNRYGAYVGAKPFLAVMRYDRVVYQEQAFIAERCVRNGHLD